MALAFGMGGGSQKYCVRLVRQLIGYTWNGIKQNGEGSPLHYLPNSEYLSPVVKILHGSLYESQYA
jgi:hypothetical protein